VAWRRDCARRSLRGEKAGVSAELLARLHVSCRRLANISLFVKFVWPCAQVTSARAIQFTLTRSNLGEGRTICCLNMKTTAKSCRDGRAL
jgi:hypothetical protein